MYLLNLNGFNVAFMRGGILQAMQSKHRRCVQP